MKFSISREQLLKPLQQVIGAVEKRQTMPTLSNILIRGANNRLSLYATDLEVELVASIHLEIKTDGETTLPARKLLDICRALPDNAKIEVTSEAERATLKSGKSRFSLATLPAADFPTIDELEVEQTIVIGQQELKQLLAATAFAMAQQDVRYYLNGLLLEVADKKLRMVATDGHRLAMRTGRPEIDVDKHYQVIVPRKGVNELQRLLTGTDGQVDMLLGKNHVRVELPEARFTSKLIDGRFPDYKRVIPDGNQFQASIDKESLRQALQRAAILSNEKYRGVRLIFGDNTLKIQAHNPEQEEAEDELEIDYQQAPVEIGFNVNYLLDVLSVLDTDTVQFWLKDANSSVLLQADEDKQATYVIMPMRL